MYLDESITDENIKNIFFAQYAKWPELTVRCPGRINLIGEHTDYNEGFVLPASINREILISFSKRSDRKCRVFAANFNDNCELDLQRIEKSKTAWINYVSGSIFQVSGKMDAGVNIAICGNIPTGAGLSSSAALEAGLIFGLNILFNLSLKPSSIILLAKKAENEFVGVQCGVMDMFASVMGRENQVIMLDCLTLEHKYFSFNNNNHDLVLINSGVKHSLGNSAYNKRRRECEETVAILKREYPSITSLRHVTEEMLNRHSDIIPSINLRRALYVVQENRRVHLFCNALTAGDFAAAGEILYAGHEGLRSMYEVSCDEIDYLVDFAKQQAPVLGSRLMGGGFGGCTINLVDKNFTHQFIEQVSSAFAVKFQIKPQTYLVNICDGTSVLE